MIPITAIFSWLIVASIAIYIVSMFLIPLNPELVVFLAWFTAILGGLSAAGLLVCVLRQRLKDRESEKDVINKY